MSVMSTGKEKVKRKIKFGSRDGACRTLRHRLQEALTHSLCHLWLRAVLVGVCVGMCQCVKLSCFPSMATNRNTLMAAFGSFFLHTAPLRLRFSLAFCRRTAHTNTPSSSVTSCTSAEQNRWENRREGSHVRSSASSNLASPHLISAPPTSNLPELRWLSQTRAHHTHTAVWTHNRAGDNVSCSQLMKVYCHAKKKPHKKTTNAWSQSASCVH